MKYKNNDFEAICSNCENAVIIHSDDKVLCKMYGIVLATYKCRKFSYDPLKRIPPRPQQIKPLEYIDLDDLSDTECEVQDRMQSVNKKEITVEHTEDLL